MTGNKETLAGRVSAPVPSRLQSGEDGFFSFLLFFFKFGMEEREAAGRLICPAVFDLSCI